VNSKNRKILIVDDSEDILFSASLLLKKYFKVVTTETNPQLIPVLLENHEYDIVLLDMNFAKDQTSGKEGFYWLEQIKQLDKEIVVILITAYGDVEIAVQAIRKGATDFVLKPWQNEKLLATISAALELRDSKIEADKLRNQQEQLSADLDHNFQEIIGESPAIRKVFDTINKVAKTDANILISGENGTGKELFARALHRASLRSEKVFINVDMGSISETLFESELFGHVKGAFTDARESRAGRFEVASGGTLFLDEIGNIPLSLQAKLLTVLQNREVTRVGSNKSIPIDIRLICATNMSIDNLISENRFRQDLLFRINTVEIHLPALQERDGDIALLANYFLEVYSRKYNKHISSISKATLQKLQSYNWPGNVRELQHAVERAVIMTENSVLQVDDFVLTTKTESDNSIHLDSFNLNDVEKTVIQSMIKKCNGNISQAAKGLGLTRAALYRRMSKYGI